MKNRTKKMITAVTLAFALTACGSASGTTPDQGAVEPEPEPVPTEAPAEVDGPYAQDDGDYAVKPDLPGKRQKACRYFSDYRPVFGLAESTDDLRAAAVIAADARGAAAGSPMADEFERLAELVDGAAAQGASSIVDWPDATLSEYMELRDDLSDRCFVAGSW